MNNNQDNLEQLFNRRFNEEEAIDQNEGWNVPADEVWDRIQMGLSKEEEVTRSVVYWPIVAVAASFLLLSIFPLYQSQQKIDLLAAKLESNEQVLKSMQKELTYVAANSRIQQKIAFQEKENVTTKPVLKETVVIDLEKIPISKNERALTNSAYSDLSVQGTNRRVYKQTENPNTEKSSIHANKNLTNSYVIAPPLSGNTLDRGVANFNAFHKETTTQYRAASAIVAVAATTNSRIKVDFPPLSNLPTLPQIVAITSSEKTEMLAPVIASVSNKKFYLAATIAPIWGTLNKKNNVHQSVNFKPKTVQQKSAYSAGIQAGMNLGKGWAVESGLRYTTTNNTTKDTRAITYQQVEEQLNNLGAFESNVNIQLGSSAGLTETVVILSRDAVSTVEEGTEIDLNLAFTNSQSFIDIPVLARKQWRLGNLGLGITAGVLNRFLLEKKFNLPTITLEDQRFNAHSMYISEKENAKERTAYLPHYLIGLDVEYKIYPGLYVFISPTLSKSIQPTIEADSADIYAQEKMLNMGVRYQL